jgi:hypothetical protein
MSPEIGACVLAFEGLLFFLLMEPQSSFDNAKRQFRKIQSRWRPVFHWHSASIIPLLFGSGVAMAAWGKFGLAYTFFMFLGLWSVGCWLTSPFLSKKQEELGKRTVRRNTALLIAESRKYCACEWGVTLLILGG